MHQEIERKFRISKEDFEQRMPELLKKFGFWELAEGSTVSYYWELRKGLFRIVESNCRELQRCKATLKFEDPITGERLEDESPMPENAAVAMLELMPPKVSLRRTRKSYIMSSAAKSIPEIPVELDHITEPFTGYFAEIETLLPQSANAGFARAFIAGLAEEFSLAGNEETRSYYAMAKEV